MTRAVFSAAVVAFVVWSIAQPALAQTSKPTVYVGPQMRDGFADIDAGIRDSIRDIRQQVAADGFRVVPSEDQATLTLIVVARGIVTAGSVGFSSASVAGGIGSGFGMVVPNTKPTLTAILRVGAYERKMQSEGETWTRAAKTAVEDLTAWWDANSSAVVVMQQSR